MIEMTVTVRLARSANRRNEGTLFPLRLTYQPESDPLAVQMVFPSDDEEEPVVWTVGRELLARGAQSEEVYGHGDVKLRRSGNTVIVCLKSPEGHADILVPAGVVNAFLENTYDLVHAGAEDVSTGLDAFLEEVLGS